MKITFQPQRQDGTYEASVLGDILTVDGVSYDFSPLEEGAILPKDAVDLLWLASDVTKEKGQISLALILPISVDATDASRFPKPIILEDGPVEFPQ